MKEGDKGSKSGNNLIAKHKVNGYLVFRKPKKVNLEVKRNEKNSTRSFGFKLFGRCCVRTTCKLR
jgi:hypothetical protein